MNRTRLAATTCTQAFWQAMMGNNPSHFGGDPARPVEQVNWYYVQNFLHKLETFLPGIKADLPTEAEWEYACRAGVGTPFFFGKSITPEQVNYKGNFPYTNGEIRVYPGKTVPVKSLPPNAWGLHEMHGNVWEWCADGLRTYKAEPAVDPVGPTEGNWSPRAVRGGSWSDYAWRVRSAYRDGYEPGLALDSLGFRLCLRSIEPG